MDTITFTAAATAVDKTCAAAVAGSLSKRSSILSLSSSSLDADQAASTSPTLCGNSESQEDSTKVASAYSREISLVDIAPEDLDALQELGDRASETIECLRINRCRMDGSTFAALVDVLCTHPFPRLHTVDISQNRVGGAQAGVALAKLLAHAKSICTLSLGWNQLALADLKALTTCGPGTHSIKSLDLRANPLGLSPNNLGKKSKRHADSSVDLDAGVDAWIGRLVAAMPNITHVLMAQATIDDSLLVTFIHALTEQHAYLEYIGLEWLGLGGRLATVRSLFSGLVPSNPAMPLRPLHLNLAANNLGDSGVKIIAESGAVLSSLTLACNFITERGAKMLAEWLPSSRLTALELSDNYFGDQGILSLLSTDSRHRSAELPYTQLTSLGLNSCCLGDASLRMLTDALACNWAPLMSLRILRNNRMSPGARVAL
ncbi:RNI-like protein [Coemansia reversa NRRL 1564]|uniref:RNI-like protein n=1 Tax=Coemansia reversa (strain ATCC 12441 / NRRL 1564) TaxID=763665 RepID=A0A2G5BKN1_COERN|nr:RNI-like protein [Coemansia reversa NRRL 1564]|eukprot:PIA19559.1 RNI-like protein [Coemansia reversa NRRL 1564]